MKKGLILVALVLLFIVFMPILTGCLNPISAPNTIENLLGVAVLAGTVAFSIKTKCLTTIKLERKHEE